MRCIALLSSSSVEELSQGSARELLSLHLKPHMKELTYEQSLQLRFRMLRMSDKRRHEISIHSRWQHGGRLDSGGKKKKSYSKYFFPRILSSAATMSTTNPTTSVLESEARVRFQVSPRGHYLSKLKTLDTHSS